MLKALQRASNSVSLRRELTQLRQSRRAQYDWVVGSTPAMKRVAETVERAAATQANVLICGESGTGKDVIANAIYQLSPRRDKPYVPVNSAAFTEQLLESELFGYEAGAFTDAKKRKTGLIESADGGTLFLDEVSSMRFELQANLLRVLETKAIRRVGGNTEIKVDVRFISATNHDLPKMIEANQFRDDLYWRLKVVQIDLPPLRERRDDIPTLAGTFLKRYNLESGKCVNSIHPRVLEALQAYYWRGNIRQLRSVIENAVMFCDGDEIQIGHLPSEITQ